MMKMMEMMIDSDADGDDEGEGEGLPQVCSEPPSQRGVSLRVRSTGTEGRKQLCPSLQRSGRKKGNPAFNPELSGTLLKSRQVMLVSNVDPATHNHAWLDVTAADHAISSNPNSPRG